MERTPWTVDGDEIVVHPKTISLGVAIGEQPSLKHFVGRESYAVDNVGRIERRLFDFGKEILRIAVQFKNSDIAQRKVFVIPYFCKIKRIDAIFLGFILAH